MESPRVSRKLCGTPSPPRTPVRRVRTLEPRAPVRAGRGSMLEAILRDDRAKVRSILAEDETAAIFPCSGGNGFQQPIVIAVRCRCSAEVIRALIEHGADPSCLEGPLNLTPLSILCGASDAVGAVMDTDSRYIKLPPPPMRRSAPAVLESFLDLPLFPGLDCSGCGFASPFSQGVNSLSRACTGQRSLEAQKAHEQRLISVARALLQAGADHRHQDATGRTPADWAEATDCPLLANFLRYRSDRQTIRWLDILRRRTQTNSEQPCHLLAMGDGIHGVVCKFLVPELSPARPE